MPYIPKANRYHIEMGGSPQNAGELNYAITRVLDAHLQHWGTSYRTINELVGVLECAKLELYRRIASPYEDEKKNENGDVYQ